MVPEIVSPNRTTRLCLILITTKEPLVFCRTACGQNMHAHCMQEWVNTRGKTPFYRVQCPYCREPWDHGDDTDAEAKVCPDIDGDAMNVYIAYLYSSGVLRLDATMPQDSDNFAVYLLRCFKLGA
jgi:hypothetical protein